MTEINDTLCGALEEGADVSGAMVCDYNTFRSLYNHLARASVRSGSDAVIVMLRLKSDLKDDKNADMTISSQIGSEVANSLRRDDAVTGFDTPQFLMLLNHLNESDAQNVINRLVKKIIDTLGYHVDIETSVEPIRINDRE